MDGEMGAVIAAADYPKAQLLSLPALADFSQVPMNVVTRKADVAFLDDYAASQFLEKNPGTLKNISQGKPVRVFENPYAFKRGEFEFARMINIAITELHNNGDVERILRKYDGHARGFYRVAAPYRVGASSQA
jgi:ABC-type amino acid transport substrate-binding protein